VRPKQLSQEAIEALVRHDWPGNVRELRNAMGRAAILAPGESVEASDLAFLRARSVSGPAGDPSSPPAAGGAGSLRAPNAAFDLAAGGSFPAAGGATSPRAPAGAFDLAAELERVERLIILQVLERTHWRMSKAAAELNLERSHLYKKLKALGIERPVED
jgi:two-component system response regulator HydG